MDSEDSEYSKLYACIYSTFVPFEGKTSWIKQNKSLSWSYYVWWPFKNLFLCFFIKFREWLFFRVLVPLHAAAERWLLNCWPGQSTSTGWWVWLEICVNFLFWLCRTDEKQICTVSFRAFSCDSCNKLSETTHEINGQMFITLSSYPFVLKAFSCSFAPRALSKLQNPWPNKIIEFILKVYILKDSRREKQ